MPQTGSHAPQRQPLTVAESQSLTVAVLAGGLATRLLPVTQRIPKSLVPIAGQPFLSHQLRLLREQDLVHVVLCVGHLGELIQDQFGDGSKYGVHIEYSFDGPDLLGTGGALRKALPLLGDAFFVLYGDSWLTVDFNAVATAWSKSGKAALMTVFQNCNSWDASNVEFDGSRILAYDKHSPTPRMRHIDYGLSVFSSSAIAKLPLGQYLDLSAIQHALVRNNSMAGFEVCERFYEIGSPSGLAELDELLAKRHGNSI